MLLRGNNRAVFLSVVLAVFLIAGFASAENIDLDEVWTDQPSYIEGVEVELVHGSDLTRMDYSEECVEFETNTFDNGTTVEECISYEEVPVAGESVPVLEFRNTDYEYLGSGELLLAFDARVNNELAGRINSGKLQEDYLLNGERIDDETFDNFVVSLEDISFGSLGGEVSASSVENTNVNAGWQSFEFVVELEEFRHGGVQLGDYSGLRLETTAYNGGGDDL